MDKESWIKEKIAKLIAEGKSQDQAVAIANSMWDEMQKMHPAAYSKPIKMPILPASPTKTVDGRQLTQGQIDAVLSYDVSKRPAIVKLNTQTAHGDQNGPAYGTIQRTYREGALIYADVIPSKGYEAALPDLCGHDGPFPFRSIEADNIEIDGQKRLWLESVALVGAQKAAIQNLPPVQFAAGEKQQFTVSLIGEESMTTENKQDQAIDFAKVKADMEADFAKKLAEKEAEFAKQREADRADAQEKTARLAKVEADLDLQKSKEFFAKIPQKYATNEKDDLVAIDCALGKLEGKITYAKEELNLREAFRKTIESRKDIRPKIEIVAGGTGSEVASGDEPKTQIEAMAKFAKENNLDIKENFAKVEDGAIAKWPGLWTGKREVK